MQPFVYFVPRTDDPAKRKTFLVFESTQDHSVLTTTVGSIKRADFLIREILARHPTTEIMIETGCLTGRELFHRVSPSLSFDETGLNRRVFLTHIFQQVQNILKYEDTVDHRQIGEKIVGLAFSARSNGGRRECSTSETLAARIGTSRGKLSPRDARRLVSHILFQVPVFFIEESKRVYGTKTKFDAKLLERTLLQLALSVLRLQQSPFPVDTSLSVFTGSLVNVTSSDGPVSCTVKSRVDDFIYGVLDGSTRIKHDLDARFPVECTIIRLTDKFLMDADILMSRIFCGAIRNRYDGIRSFLDLLFGAWTVSYYADQDAMIRIVDTSLLSSLTRKNFEKRLAAIKAV